MPCSCKLRVPVPKLPRWQDLLVKFTVILTAIRVAESAGGLARSISFPGVYRDWRGRGTACPEKNCLPGLSLYFERLLLLYTIASCALTEITYFCTRKRTKNRSDAWEKPLQLLCNWSVIPFPKIPYTYSNNYFLEMSKIQRALLFWSCRGKKKIAAFLKEVMFQNRWFFKCWTG